MANLIGEVTRAFTAAGTEVLENEMGTPTVARQFVVRGGAYRTDDVTVIIGLARDVAGAMILSTSLPTALAYVTHVTGAAKDDLDAMGQSGVGELANVIAGRAGVRMATKGYDMVIMPPTILLRRGATLSTLRLPRLVLPISTPLGLVELHVATKR